MQSTMTIKEIAQLTGKSTRQINYWINAASKGIKYTTSAKKQPEIISGKDEIISGLKSKVLAAQDSNTGQQYTLKEVILIIEAGNNDTLANLLMDNAQQSNVPAVTHLTDKQALLDIAIAIVDRVMGKYETRFQRLESQVKSLPAPKQSYTIDKYDYCSIEQYVDYNKLRSKLPTFRYNELKDMCWEVINRKRLTEDRCYFIRGQGFMRCVIDEAILQLD